MPASKDLLLCFVLASLSAQASRLKQHSAGGKQTGGPHKCTITWPARGIGAPATASFGVGSCMIKCKITNADVRPTKMFPSGFKAEQAKKSCSCQTTEGRELFKYQGTCGAEAEAQNKCFEIYTTMMTDDYESEFNRETLKVMHNPKLSWDKTYDYTKCEQNACEGEECTEHYLPSLWESRNDKEKKLLAELIKKAATEGGKDLTVQQKELIRTLGKDDIEQAAEIAKKDATGDVADQIQALFLRVADDEDVIDSPTDVEPEDDEYTKVFKDLVARVGKDGGFTVKQLKDEYKYLLGPYLVSVDHMANVASSKFPGLAEDDHVVTLDEFVAFLKPEC